MSDVIEKSYLNPSRKILSGRYCTLHPFQAQLHAKSLYKAFAVDDAVNNDWEYLPYGPFHSYEDFFSWLSETCLEDDPLFYSIHFVDDLDAVGLISFLNIVPAHGSIEIGHVHFSPKLQRTRAATECIYLMMCFAFDVLGYRRLEWKCHDANLRSKRCATRLGFTFEGLFRQHRICKSRNRDTAWFAIIDKDWPDIRARLERWLSPDNFNAEGQQFNPLDKLNSSIAQ